MIEKRSTQQAVLDALGAQPEASTVEIAEVVGIGRSSAAKQLATLERAGKIARHPGGRKGRKRLPDRWVPASETKASTTTKPAVKSAGKRLRPGELDGIVLAFMRERAEDAPLSASAIGKGIGRSSGAVANCLARLAKVRKVRLEKSKPRRYAVSEASRE
jgi:biotin operon repressor